MYLFSFLILLYAFCATYNFIALGIYLIAFPALNCTVLYFFIACDRYYYLVFFRRPLVCFSGRIACGFSPFETGQITVLLWGVAVGGRSSSYNVGASPYGFFTVFFDIILRDYFSLELFKKVKFYISLVAC